MISKGSSAQGFACDLGIETKRICRADSIPFSFGRPMSSTTTSFPVKNNNLESGATGYVSKSDAAVELLNAVEAVLLGKRFVSKRLTDRGLTGDP